jgi:hypothetical protein
VSCDKDTGESDGKYPPTMRLKVPQRDGTWQFVVQDKDQTVLRINEPDGGDHLEDIFVKNCKTQLIMQCVGVWVASGNYMCQWKVVRAMVDVPDVSGNACFLPDSDVEDEDEDDDVSDVVAPLSNGPQMLEDSDEEVDEEVDTEVEDIVVETPNKSKKRILKKKST